MCKKAVLQDGTRVNIEIQLQNEYNMDRRILFCWSKEYYKSLKRGRTTKNCRM
jgi:predicted transposase/invertase (TIGR01784 family)